jgi:hypothetical protein
MEMPSRFVTPELQILIAFQALGSLAYGPEGCSLAADGAEDQDHHRYYRQSSQ